MRRIALPVMERLRDVTGENTTLHELRDGKRVCVEKVESKQVLRDTMLIGDQFPGPLRRFRESIARPSSRRGDQRIFEFG